MQLNYFYPVVICLYLFPGTCFGEWVTLSELLDGGSLVSHGYEFRNFELLTDENLSNEFDMLFQARQPEERNGVLLEMTSGSVGLSASVSQEHKVMAFRYIVQSKLPIIAAEFDSHDITTGGDAFAVVQASLSIDGFGLPIAHNVIFSDGLHGVTTRPLVDLPGISYLQVRMDIAVESRGGDVAFRGVTQKFATIPEPRSTPISVLFVAAAWLLQTLRRIGS